MTQPDLRISPTPADLFHAAAIEFAARAKQAVESAGRFSVALSGGSTPRGMFTLLATNEFSNLPWDKIYFFWGDERHVPPDSSESNFRMANESLLTKIPARPENIFRIPAEGSDADAVARAYEQTLRTFFAVKPGQFPRFDFILLGLGPDGHTASLFPGTAALEEAQRVFVANWVPKMNDFRFTLTFPAINHAACVAFLVSGADKASTVKEVLRDADANLPSQRIKPENGNLIWFLDQAAASQL